MLLQLLEILHDFTLKETDALNPEHAAHIRQFRQLLKNIARTGDASAFKSSAIAVLRFFLTHPDIMRPITLVNLLGQIKTRPGFSDSFHQAAMEIKYIDAVIQNDLHEKMTGRPSPMSEAGSRSQKDQLVSFLEGTAGWFDTHETVEQRLHYVKQDGQAVFKFAVRKTEEISRRVMERNGVTAGDVALFVSHQANRRIIEAAAHRLGFDDRQVIINLEKYGNTTAGTIPLALEDAVRDGRLKKGDLVLLASVGAGFTVGSVLLRWAL